MRNNARSTIFPRGLRFGVIANQIAPQPNDPPPDPHIDALNTARLEADQARGELARMRREFEELKGKLPTEEQRARYAELEEQARRAEEERARKEGDFQAWRQQVTEKSERDLQAERSMRENAEAKAREAEKELEETLIGRCFADATDLFGPGAKTVLLPEVAQSFFTKNVRVETDEATKRRKVIVLDMHGAPILDTKTGKPMEFSLAMGQLIEGHPRKEHLLRNSGKVGAGSVGGAHGGAQGIDTRNLRSKDFKDPSVREAVRTEQAGAGGLQVGRAFDDMRARQTRK